MSRKYCLKERYHKKLSYFLLCQMKIMIAVSLAVVGMNSLLTNVHAETETYGIYKNDGKVYLCEEGGNSVGNEINVKDVCQPVLKMSHILLNISTIIMMLLFCLKS